MIVAWGLSISSQAAAAQDVAPPDAGFLLTTAGPGGVYAPLGRSLCTLYNRERREPSDPACRAVLSTGSVENIERLRRGEAAMAVVQSDTAYWAVVGEGPFREAEPYGSLRVLFPVHDEAITILLGKGVQARVPEDLLALRVGVDPSRTGPRATLDALLEALKWTRDDFADFSELPVDALVDGLCAGRLEAIAIVVGHPNGYVQRALYECDARLMPFVGPLVETAEKALAFLDPGEIPARSYRTQVDAVPSPVMTALVVTTAKLPDTHARRFVEGIMKNEAVLRQMHPALQDLELSRSFSMSAALGRHPALSAR